MECPKCHTIYEDELNACPNCSHEPKDKHYVKPAHTCKNCATPLRPGDQYCPSCGFDQSRSIIKQTSNTKATRLIGPMVGLFAFLFLVVASLGLAYYFISRANSDEAIRAESVRMISRSSNETINTLKQTHDADSREGELEAFRRLLERAEYRNQIADALSQMRTTDLKIVPGPKTLRYIPTHQLTIDPVKVSITATDVTYRVQFGDNPEWVVEQNTALNVDVIPGIYTVTYQAEGVEPMSEEIDISHHSPRFKAGEIKLEPKAGSKLPKLQSSYKSAQIYIDGSDSGLKVRDVDLRPSLIGIHAPGTKFQLKITTKLGQVVTDEVVLADAPLSFKLQNGLELANSVATDLVYVNGELVGSYRDFSDSDYVLGPIEVGKDLVRLQGEAIPETPFEQILSQSLGGKEVAIELTEELKNKFISETKRFTLDSYNALKDKDFARYTNILPGSELETRLKDSLDVHVASGAKLDYAPFALRFSNDSFKVYARDGKAYAEFIESYFIKYLNSEYQNHTSWLKKMVYDEAQDKWFFFEDEMLNEYEIPEDNTLTFFE